MVSLLVSSELYFYVGAICLLYNHYVIPGRGQFLYTNSLRI